MGTQLWTEKYRPRRYTDLIFSGDVHHDALDWLKEYPRHGEMLLINGPPGVGKTTLVHILASLFGMNLIEFNASNESNYMERIAGLNGTIDMRKNLVLIDEIDNSPSLNVGRLRSAVDLTHPIVLISNDMHIKGIYTLNVRKPEAEEMKRGIERVCKGEGIQIDHSVLSKIVEHSGCDFRAIVNYLQVCGRKVLTNRTYSRIEKWIPTNQYRAAERLLSRHMGWGDYEEYYSNTVLSLCHGSFLHNTDVLGRVVSICESTSLADILPDEYRHICLSKYNGCNSRNVELRRVEHCRESRSNVTAEYVLPYFKKYNLERSDERGVRHLEEIVRMYSIKDVEIRRKEDIADSTIPKPSGRFRFRYKDGHTSATRRDIAVRELLG